MKILQNNPTIVQTGWEPKKGMGKECYLIAPAIEGGKPILVTSKVVVMLKDKGADEEILKSRLADTQ